MKKCNCCGSMKILEEFYTCKGNLDGKHNTCKICWKIKSNKNYSDNVIFRKQQVKKYREDNREKYLECSRNYYRKTKEKGEAFHQRNRTRHLEILELYRSKNKDKIKAHNIFNQAVLKGELVRELECSLCGSDIKVEAHHKDYSKPLKVIYLCKRCHIGVHKGRICEN